MNIDNKDKTKICTNQDQRLRVIATKTQNFYQSCTKTQDDPTNKNKDKIKAHNNKHQENTKTDTNKDNVTEITLTDIMT